MARSVDLFRRLSQQGQAAVEELVDTRVSEELFLDFKRSANDGVGKNLHESDRNHYAKALSGFANSEGGVIVWGVDCRPGPDGADIARSYHPLTDAQGFLSRLEAATSGCTVPACPMVTHAVIPIDQGPSGFVISHIPKSHLAPHQCIRPLNYYMRAGSSFIPVPHSVLLGLFGRRAASPIFHMWAVEPPVRNPANAAFSAKCTVGIMLSSHGPGVVRDLFLNVYAEAPAGGSSIVYEFLDPKRWECHTFANRAYAVSADGYKLAPEVMAMPIKLHITLQPPFAGDWNLVVLYGHAESPTSRFQCSSRRDEIEARVRTFAASRDPDPSFVEEVLGLDVRKSPIAEELFE